MPLISLACAGFVLLALAVHQILPRGARPPWLLLASYVFYALVAWRFLPVLLGLTAATFLIAGRLTPGAPRRSLWLWTGLGLNLAALAGLRELYRANPFAGPFAVLGCSFYTLQAMSYLLDIHSGAMRARGSLRDLALYLAYFPKLAAGPIERARTFFPQIAQPRAVDQATVSRAGTLIAIGLTRKLVIADPLLARLPAEAFVAPAKFGAAVLAVTIVGYAFALYNDFAGYTNLARGASRLFGIELSANFHQPFFARSFTEFWNRWHATLSHWLRDYIFLPVSRALFRRNASPWTPAQLLLPPMFAMLAGGLWHGSGLHMLVWGGLHGGYLAGERLLTLSRVTDRFHLPSRAVVLVGRLVVFILGCWALVAFRTDLAATVAWWSTLLRGPLGALPDAGVLWYIAPSMWLDWMEQRHGEDSTFDHWPRLGRAALLAAAMLLWFLMTRGGPPAPFIYRGF
jgi:alginate O-acetyltransferase complex protein AlgI